MPSTLSQLHSSPEPQAEAARWFARLRSGDCSSEEQQAFVRWLNAGEANRNAYKDAESLWQQLWRLETIADRRLLEARAHLIHARRRTMRRRALAFALAASLTAVVVWSADWLSYLDDRTYRTVLGERQTVTLADGSRLELNTDTEVAVHYSRHSRELKLVRGQAAFTVAHGDTRSFDVFADNGRIRDIGTQFDVRRRAGRVSVAVLEGAVEVSSSDIAATRSLRQGQRLNYTPHGDFSDLEFVDVAALAAWREGQLVFNGLPLGEVLDELGRYHAISLTVTPSRIMDIKVSGTFPTDNLEVALTTIAASLSLKLTQTGPQSWQLDG